MNLRITDTFRESLIKQLVYFDENSSLFLQSISDINERSQTRDLLSKYCQQIKQFLDGQSNVGPDTLAWIGSEVKIRNETDGVDEDYSIVMPADINPYEGRISFMSPLGQRLLLSQIGYRTEIDSPAGKYWVTVKGLSYSE